MNIQIVDLPSTNAVTAYYLGNVCGHDDVRLFGESDGHNPSGTVYGYSAAGLDDLTIAISTSS